MIKQVCFINWKNVCCSKIPEIAWMIGYVYPLHELVFLYIQGVEIGSSSRKYNILFWNVIIQS